MDNFVNEHTKTLIAELMRSLSIQRELLCELDKMTRIVPNAEDDYAEKRYEKALSRRKGA